MRVLVTGGGGFVGRTTVAALREAGHNVLIASRRAGIERSGYTSDILNKSERQLLLKKVNADALVHLAWQTSPEHFWTAPDNMDWAGASYDLIERFFDAGGKRAVVAGSCAEYDWSVAEKPLTETAPCRPTTLYGACKLDLYHHCKQLMAAGASIAWARLFFLLGPREHPARFVPSIIQALLAGQTANMSKGSQIRDFLHVVDAGRALAALVDAPLNGIVNVASGVGVSLAELAQAAQNQIGLGRLNQGVLPIRPDDPPRLVADVHRLQNEVEFDWSLDWLSALDTCVDYWRREGRNIKTGNPHKILGET